MVQSVFRRLRHDQIAEPQAMGAAESGFTLIELMVVLLIIAILLAIAIPTFLGVTSSANDRAAQANLTNADTESSSQYQAAGQTYANVSALLVASAPEFTWTAATTQCTTSQPNCISIYPVDVATAADQQGLILAAMSKTGTCWWVAHLQAAPTPIAATGFELTSTSGQPGFETGAATAGTFYAKSQNATPANCNAKYAETRATGFTWGTSYSTATQNT